ncbi:MAG: MBL fold metallo-hydrolase [Candidatus Thermoplasmatota archaeon]
MDFINFLGTGGARYVVTRQIRKSGGIWVSLDGSNILIDPGPGSLSSLFSNKPKLSPLNLDGIILSHRHIDHSNDINIMIEAMTNGGYKKRGEILAPKDAVYNDPVILKHFRNHITSINILKEKGKYKIGNITISTPVKNIHGVETYSFNIVGNNKSLSIISDTKYFEGLTDYFKSDILIIYVVLKDRKKNVLHLSIKDVEKIVNENKPQLTILTHFGMNLIRSNPDRIARSITKRTGCRVIAANDGQRFEI